MLKPSQAGAELRFRVLPDVGDTGDHIGQVDQDTLLICPSGALQSAALPAPLRIADLQAVSAAVLQQGKRGSRRDFPRLGGPALTGVDGQGLLSAAPGGGPRNVQFKAFGRRRDSC